MKSETFDYFWYVWDIVLDRRISKLQFFEMIETPLTVFGGKTAVEFYEQIEGSKDYIEATFRRMGYAGEA